MRNLITFIGMTAFSCSLGIGTLYAQKKSKLGLSPADQQRYDDLISSAERSLMIGYIAAGVAVLFVIGMIVYSFRSRGKKNSVQPKDPENPLA